MATERRALTVYRIRESVGGQRVENLEDVIADPASLIQHDLTGAHEFEARLFVAKPNIRQPPWVGFLEPGFGELTEIADGVTNSAVLVAKVRCDEDCFFALTFGFGRYLLKSNSFEPSYGLRVALNAFYPTDGQAEALTLDRVRSVDAKTVAANTLHTRRQADRRTTFEDFGLDVQRDLLRAITGRPVDTGQWGTRLTGAGALRLNVALEIDGLGDLLRQIERTSQREDYRERFAWIDNVRTVTDREIIAALEDELLNKLKARDIGRLQMAPPELVEWDEIDYFRVSVKRSEAHDDVDLDNYLDVLEDGGKLDGLTVKQLRTAHRLEAVDVNGEVRGWPMFGCIGGELELSGETYLISAGDFFEVSPGYLEELDDYIEHIPECDKVLPDSTVKTTEGDYNKDAADSSPDYLLLDKKTVRVSGKTSPIEVCDIMTRDGTLIHVKRKLASASLSHLFAQGYVSGDLFHMNQEYREAVLVNVRQAEQERADATGDSSFLGRFSSFDPAGISPQSYEVVYAIVADWKNRTFVESLPFFSKVNLRRHARDLGRMGYKVSHKRVQADAVD